MTAILNAETEKNIHDIEIGAGYYAEKIQIGGDLVTIFLFEEVANNLRIDSGDWVIFFDNNRICGILWGNFFCFEPSKLFLYFYQSTILTK